MIGQTISHYRIVEKLGEGGMGVVYKAEDTKLERTVALKFLAAHLLNDPEAKQRFLREAKSAAALHHPNICTVYEVDEAEGKTFLAMAFLKGETLEDRIAKGPLPLKDAFDIGRQVAEGLAAAHAEGIVHRDIKPANILISPEGRATIMDFGLARLTEASKLTRADQTVGTAAYMSPEQIQGGEVDQRADIWSLGCVLYEMVAGQRPFKGVYDQALLYEVVHEQVAPLTSVRAGVPMELEFIVGECLAKDRDDRTGTAQEVSRKLRTLAEKLKSGRSTVLQTTALTGGLPAAMTGAQTLNPATTLPPDAVLVKRSSQRALQSLAAALAIGLLALAFVHFTQEPPEKPVRRFSFAPDGYVEKSSSISPDGRFILFLAGNDSESSLWLRSLSNETVREIPGTSGSVGGFWSPDSTTVAFAVGGASPQLKRVSINGGDPIVLSALPSRTRAFVGGTWSLDGTLIVFSSGLQLYKIAAQRGEAQLLFDADDDPRLSTYPHFLPADGGARWLVYTAGENDADLSLVIMDLKSGERRDLGPGSRGVYSATGFLIHGPSNFIDEGLHAVRFSLDALQATGPAFPIDAVGGGASVSLDGTLAYSNKASGGGMKTLVWRNRAGQAPEIVGQPQLNLREFALSPDRRSAAVTVGETSNPDIWIQNLTRSTAMPVASSALGEFVPIFSPSGREVVYTLGGGVNRLMRKAADGSGEPTALIQTNNLAMNPDWSLDGRYLVFSESNPATGRDIRYVEFGADGAASAPITLLDTPAGEQSPKLSPDGRFLAYVSGESGRPEVYVRSFPSGEGKQQVSVNGGTQPRWRSDGREMYYVDRRTLMALPVSTGPELALGQPQKLFESADLLPESPSYAWPLYDVSADGQRFLMATPVADGTAVPPKIRIVENWYEEFRDRKQE